MSERESFEVHAKRRGLSLAYGDVGYAFKETNEAWMAWQASREALKAEHAFPESLPCPVLLEPGLRFGKGVKTQLLLDALQRRAAYYAEREAMTPEQRAEQDDAIRSILNLSPIDTTSQQYEALSKGESK